MTPYHPAQTEETLEKARVVRSMAARGSPYADIAETLDLSEGRVAELVRNAREEGLDPVQPRALGAYIFAGGFTQGVKQYFDVVAHLEDGNYGVETSRANHPEIAIHTEPDMWPVSQLRDLGIEFIYANPPCAPWSRAGSKNKGPKRDYSEGFDPRDDRVECAFNAFGLLEELRPRVWAMESVTQLFTSGRKLVDQFAEQAMELGYAVSIVKHNGLDCGAPQNRHRVFLVFHDVELPWRAPSVDGPKTIREAWAQVGDDGYEALHPMDPKVSPCWEEELECLRQTPPGGKTREVYMEIFGESLYDPEARGGQGIYKGRPGFLRTRLEFDEPSPTITGGAAKYHPAEDRHLSVLESQLLCGYPPGYEFRGGMSVQYQQIAQAVMPPVGRWLAGVVRTGLENPTLVDVPTFTLYDYIRQDRDEPIPLQIGDGVK